MRAKEFITEIKTPKITNRQGTSTTAIHLYTDAERRNSDYVSYRLGMAVACTDGTNVPDMDGKSWVDKSKTTHPYTPQEQEMLKKAYKVVGAKYTDLTKGDMRSQELSTTNTVSPVAKIKKNKYGV